MQDQFKVQPCAYLGITVPNFPNFFYVLGPNTVLAHSSLVYMIECQVKTKCPTVCILKLQVNYILQTLEKMAELKVNTIEPRFFSDEHFLRLSFSIPGKIVRLTSKVKWVTGLKDGTSQPSAGSFMPSVFIHLHVHCTGPGTRTARESTSSFGR